MDSPNSSSASEASSHRYPHWVMLDPHTRLNYPRPTLDHDYPEEDYLATNAHDVTSRGDRIGVWFRAVPPPGASRLYIHWTPRRRSKSSSEEAGRGEHRRRNLWAPQVLGAHDNSIILELTLRHNRSDFFVYTARSTGPPSLLRLPRCDKKFIDGDLQLDHMVKPDYIGLLCDVEREEFVVADLMIVLKYDDASSHNDDDTPVVVGLCVYRSRDHGDGWEARRLRILHEKGQGKELIVWHTDAVVPCGVSLCYVDYFLGILFLDVLSKSPQLKYVRLPLDLPLRGPYDGECGLPGCPESFRSVCVTDGGTMKFVDVVTTTVFVSSSRSATALFDNRSS